MPTRKQLAAQLAALNAKTAKDVAAAQAEIDTTNSTIAAANQPYEEEFATGLPDIPGYLKAIDTGLLPPGILKTGFTEGPLPEKYQGMLGNPDILGWRLVTNPDGSQNIQVQTGVGSTSTFGADVSGNAPKNGNGGPSNITGSNTTLKTPEQIAKEATDAANKAARQSAYDLLYSQFKQYGLESLVEPLKGLIQKDISPSQFTIELRNTPQYQTRFAANAQRVKNGFKALDEATYLGLEDSYQKLMMNYGLPNLYWEKSDVMGAQPGFEKLIAGNVDPIELEQRLQLGIDQLEKGPKQYMDAMKEFFPEISRGDILAYVLDPANALKAIQSKVKTAQIGGEYLRAGLGTSEARASELARQGVTADIARANIPTIIEAATRGGQLSDIYARHGLGEYNQATAEEELYNLGKAAEAKKKREQYGALEQSSFSGKTGVGALESGRAGLF